MSKRAVLFTFPLAAAMLAGCSAPVFRQPQVAVPPAWKESSVTQAGADGTRWKTAEPAEAAPRGLWWRAFNDTMLNQLMDEAIAANQNLAVAAARVGQARAIAGIARADRIAQIGINAGVQRAKSSPLELGLPKDVQLAPANLYQAQLTASYEVDLFGRVKSNIAAAHGDALASEANYRSVLLALQADVAQMYFRLRETDAELLTLAETVKLREQDVHINTRRFELGDIGEFDLSRAQTELSTTRAEAVGLQRQRVGDEHALAVLLGRPAASFTFSGAPLNDGEGLPRIPAGLPSALLERRPDIAAAQRTMEAANARIGVARAAIFPSFNIVANGGGVSDTLHDVFEWSSRSWMLGALTSMPLIDGGRNRNNVLRSEAALEEAVAAYRQSVLVAFAEVEDNLAGLRILAEQAAQIDAALGSARRSAALAQMLYDAGRSNYLDLLDAQRNLTAVERSAVQLRGSRATASVALIRALGGGWDGATAPEPGVPGAGAALAKK